MCFIAKRNIFIYSVRCPKSGVFFDLALNTVHPSILELNIMYVLCVCVCVCVECECTFYFHKQPAATRNPVVCTQSQNGKKLGPANTHTTYNSNPPRALRCEFKMVDLRFFPVQRSLVSKSFFFARFPDICR